MEKWRWIYYYGMNFCRRVFKKLKWTKLVVCRYKNKKTLDRTQAQDAIKTFILEGKPALISRFGSVEAQTTADAIGVSLGVKRHMNKKCLQKIRMNAGVFPYGEETAMRFAEISREAAKQVDILGEWKTSMQSYLINCICPDTTMLTKLGCLEPYTSPTPWSAALRGKKVLVIHPFKETIEKQYKKRELLFENPDVLPEFELFVLKAVQTIAGEEDARFQDWFEALDYMYEEAMKIDFDVAIIGCGAYGMPLGAMLKQRGKTVIHLGGVTQLLFGIKGARWDNQSLARFYNEHWVRPSESETPAGAHKIEGACYW